MSAAEGWGGGPQVNKFQQISLLGHEMSLAKEKAWARAKGSLYKGGLLGLGRGGSLCMVRSNASCVMVTLEPPPLPQ